MRKMPAGFDIRRKLVHHPILLLIVSNIFHFSFSHLMRELEDSNSVLDLGCGKNSPLALISDRFYSVGVELFRPYLCQSKRNKIHDDYVLGDIALVSFREKSFDSVLLLDVLEHLDKQKGGRLLSAIEKVAKKKVIITTPTHFLHQSAYDQNPLQTHISAWTVDELRGMRFRVRGLQGLWFLRGEKGGPKFRPPLLNNLITYLTQVITYFLPKTAFELFCVKDLKSADS